MRTLTALLFTASIAFAGDKDVERRLDTRISLDLRETRLSDAIDIFRSVTGLNFVVEEGADIPVTIKVLDLRARSVLTLLLKPRNLEAAFEHGAVVIRAEKCSMKNLVVRLYDVGALTALLQDFPGREVGAGADPLCCFAMPLPEEAKAIVDREFLVSLVRSHTGGRSWDLVPETSVSMRNGHLIVRQSAEVHREIATLLKKLGH